MTRPTPPSIHPPGHYTSLLGGLLALAGTVVCVYLWADSPPAAAMCAVSGWGFAGTLWALGGIAGQLRALERRRD